MKTMNTFHILITCCCYILFLVFIWCLCIKFLHYIDIFLPDVKLVVSKIQHLYILFMYEKIWWDMILSAPWASADPCFLIVCLSSLLGESFSPAILVKNEDVHKLLYFIHYKKISN